MKTLPLTWTLGCTQSADQIPTEIFPANVPGAAQRDYANFKNWPDPFEGVNYLDYAPLEDVYWHYTAPLSFSVQEAEIATLVFKGIDYKYRISVNEDVLCEGEGMFSHIRCDVTTYAGQDALLHVMLYPVPKADDSNSRDQARLSCKAAACYGWDWHPRLVSAGLWDDVELIIENKRSIAALDARYTLNENFSHCTIKTDIVVNEDGPMVLHLKDGDTVVAESTVCACGKAAQASLELKDPKLWYPTGYGEQHLYTLEAVLFDDQGNVADVKTRKLGLRRSQMVMNEGSWIEPVNFPKSRSDAPATLQINGRRIFAKGSNWVNAQVFPGEMCEDNYRELLTLVKNANMNILRIWGGGFVNKESFFDLCDEMGIMVWQEFPLSCTEYPDNDGYLAVLEKEATAIVRRLRTHPCVVLWCGGNELFNNWSLMTDQHHALRLLDKVCYIEDRFTPYIMTSPLNGMGHGHYINYDETIGKETITTLVNSSNTAYTEFGSPAGADAEYILKYMSEEDFADCNADNAVWTAHHAFGAWVPGTWLRKAEADYYFGGYSDIHDLLTKTQFLQAMNYRSYFEEMRKQWPHCSMALNWCFNEPWPCFANNSLIAWPALPRPSYIAVQQALRPQLASLRVDRHLWWAGETFKAEIWLLNDALTALDKLPVHVYYRLDDEEEFAWGTLTSAGQAAQTHHQLGAIHIALPKDFSGKIAIRLAVEGHPEMDSEYEYPCRREEAGSTKKILNL